jgi:hypothetical protein
LSPVEELIARIQDSSGGDDGLNHNCTIKAWLVVCCAVGESERQKSPFGDTVVKGRRCPFQCNQYSHRCNVNDVNHEMELACDTNIQTTIYKLARNTINCANSDVGDIVAAKTTNP